MFRNAHRTALAIVTMVMISAVPAAAQVQNGGFESSTPVPFGGFTTYGVGQNFGNWTVGSGTIDLINGYWQAAGGTYSVDMDGYNPGSIFQDLITNPGSQYSLSFAMAGNPGSDPIKTLNVFWNGAYAQTFTFDITGHSTGAMGWQTMVLSNLVASGTQTRLEFRSGTTASGGCCQGPALDDVAITETTSTPEPASVVLLASGLVGVGAVSRRRRRTDVRAIEA